jgi:stage II sporulation protein D
MRTRTEQAFPFLSLILSVPLLLSPLTLAAETTPQSALWRALKSTPAIGVVVDVSSGRQIAAINPTNQPAAPGSILKPLFLAGALEQKQVQPQTTVFCRRDLRIGQTNREWNLPCTHPQTDTTFNAQEALAYSCNRYFAALADRLSPPQVSSILDHYGLTQAHPPQSREEKELLVLGLTGITVSPAQMAAAYRKLAMELDTPQGPEAVREGLKDSVRYGMAHNAAVPGVEIAGKTGTVTDGGWFAGTGYFGQKQVVIVIYLQRATGADAARLAQQFFLAARGPVESAPESARNLTVELWAAQTVTHLTATPVSGARSPLQLQWTPGKPHPPLALTGAFRMQAGGAPEVLAAGNWTITWRADGLRVLLTLPSENYVIAALSGEAAPDEPMASLKAMAISMRTFALVNANRHQAEGFGLCDSTHCQALRLGKARPEVERAVRETAGETLWSGSQRAHIYYSQHCGGMSEAAGAVWPVEHAGYLVGNRADPYCLRRSPAQWQTRIPLTQLDTIFRAQGWRTPSPIETIHVIRLTHTGRAELLEVTGRGAPAQLSASSFRFAVNRALGWNQVRSDWYTAGVSGEYLEIKGKGYGHGVGLCQAGAYEMAREGDSTREILNFYFPGTATGITPADQGWQQLAGNGWTLLTTNPSNELLAEGNAAWSKAHALLGGPGGSKEPVVQELPTIELFRQTTGEPGWMLASTRGSDVFLEPAAVRQKNGGTGDLLLHEFLHVLLEQQAGEHAPLWLREGLVETLANSSKKNLELLDLSPGEVDSALAHPANAAASRHAHQLAARMAALLCARYGVPTVRDFLRNGVPSEALKSLDREPARHASVSQQLPTKVLVLDQQFRNDRPQ